MNNNYNVKMLVQISCITLLVTILSVAAFYLPSIVIITALLSAAALIILTIKVNKKTAILAMLIIYIITSIFTKDIIGSTAIILTFAGCAVVLGYGFKEKWEFSKLFITSTFSYLISLIIIILLFDRIKGVNLINNLIIIKSKNFFNLIQQSIIQNLKGISSLYNQELPLSEIKNYFEELQYFISMLVPAFLITICIFLGYFTITICKTVLRLKNYDYRYLPNFYELKISKKIMGAYLLSFLLSLLIQNEILNGVLVNIIFVLSIILIIAGLSVIDYFVKKAGIPGIIRAIIYIIVFTIIIIIFSLFSYFNTIFTLMLGFLNPINILIIIGITDSIFDLRKLRNKGENHEK